MEIAGAIVKDCMNRVSFVRHAMSVNTNGMVHPEEPVCLPYLMTAQYLTTVGKYGRNLEIRDSVLPVISLMRLRNRIRPMTSSEKTRTPNGKIASIPLKV